MARRKNIDDATAAAPRKRKLTEEERAAKSAANREKHRKMNEEREARWAAEAAQKKQIRAAAVEARRAILHPELPEFEEKHTVCTQDIFETICMRMADGERFNHACHDIGIRKYWVHAFLLANPENRPVLDAAKRMQAESWADTIIELADVATPEDVAVIKTQIETRKWIMGKNSSRFAERSTLALEGGDPKKPLEMTIKPGMTAAEAAAAYAATRRQYNGEE
jgi:hypothetical protein